MHDAYKNLGNLTKRPSTTSTVTPLLPRMARAEVRCLKPFSYSYLYVKEHLYNFGMCLRAYMYISNYMFIYLLWKP